VLNVEFNSFIIPPVYTELYKSFIAYCLGFLQAVPLFEAVNQSPFVGAKIICNRIQEESITATRNGEGTLFQKL